MVFCLNHSDLSSAIAPLPPLVSPDVPLSDVLIMMGWQGKHPDQRLDATSTVRDDSDCVLVVDNNDLVGILTAQSSISGITENCQQNPIVGDVMTRNPISLRRSQLRDEVSLLNLFREHSIRHLPIVDDQDYPIGIITPAQLFRDTDPLELYETICHLQQTVTNLRTENTELKKNRNIKLQTAIAQLEAEIAERRETESRLRSSMDTNQALLNAIPDPMFRISREGIFVNYKVQQEEQLFAPPQEFLGKNVRDVFPATLAEQILQHVERALETDELQIFECELPKVGKPCCWEARFAVSAPDEVMVITRDITERKQIEENLRQSLKELSDFKYALNQGTICVITDATGVITYVNDKFCEVCKYSREELIGQTPSLMNSSFHPADFFKDLWHTITSGQTWRGEIKNRSKDGREYWVDTTIVPFLSETNQPLQYLAIQTDITDRRRTEEALQKSEHRFRQSLTHAPFPVMVHAENGEVVYLNQAWTQITGFTRQDIPTIAEWAKKACHERHTALEMLFNRIYQLDSHAIEEAEISIQSIDRVQRIWSLRSAFLGYTSDGRRLAISVASDITELKQAEQAFRRQQEFLKNVIDANPNLIFVKDWEGRFTLANQAVATLYNTDVESLIGKTETDVGSNPSEVARHLFFDKWVRESLETKFISEETFTSASGEVRYFQTIKKPLPAIESPACYVLEVATDITDRKRAEVEVRKALEKEKELNELKSRFISMTSHEFRTPLAVIASSAGILKDFGDKLSEAQKQKHFQCIQNYVKHTTQLLDDILLINRAESGNLAFEPESFDLVEFCQQLTEEMQLSAPDHTLCLSILPNREKQETIVPVCMDKKLLRQILINLLSNAVKYSPATSRVWFDLTLEDNTATFLVRDEGIGIPEEDQVNIFQSFHRAKNVGTTPGNGLGLAIVNKCTDLHNGKVMLRSKVGEGTLITVSIPRFSSHDSTIKEKCI